MLKVSVYSNIIEILIRYNKRQNKLIYNEYGQNVCSILQIF